MVAVTFAQHQQWSHIVSCHLLPITGAPAVACLPYLSPPSQPPHYKILFLRSPVASPPHYQWPAWLPYLSAGHNIGTLGENATTGFRTFDISRISTCTNSCTSVSNAITDTKEGKSLDMNMITFPTPQHQHGKAGLLSLSQAC